MNKQTILNNPGCERTVLASILQRGSDGLIDIEEILDVGDFYQKYAQKLYKVFKYLVHDQQVKTFDIASIEAASKKLDVYPIVGNNKDDDFIQALMQENVNPDNARKFASQVYKLRLARDAWMCLHNTKQDIGEIDGTENIDIILNKIEDPVFNFTSKIASNNSQICQLSDNIDFAVQSLLDSPKDILGIPSGFPKWDLAIGGGLRPESVNLIGARAKRGKSFLCLNISHNVAKLNIPVLYLDTELTKKYQLMRLLSLVSGVNLSRVETGQFGTHEGEKEKVVSAAEQIKQMPITYCSIAGHSIKSVLSIARRWLIKNVGLDSNGRANPCLLVYDYLKLMDSGDFKSNLAEHQLLGFLMTDLHNFAVRWGVPVLATAQLNRDGVEQEGSHVFAGSDRLLWLCTSASILKNKDDDDLSNDPISNGKQKIVVTDTRFGYGLESNDYINVKNDYAKAIMTEGPLFSEIAVLKNDQVSE